MNLQLNVPQDPPLAIKLHRNGFTAALTATVNGQVFRLATAWSLIYHMQTHCVHQLSVNGTAIEIIHTRPLFLGCARKHLLLSRSTIT